MTTPPPDLPLLDRAELGALLMAGVVVLALVCVAACAVPVLDAVRRRLR
jgi:hypothetical protein